MIESMVTAIKRRDLLLHRREICPLLSALRSSTRCASITVFSQHSKADLCSPPERTATFWAVFHLLPAAIRGGCRSIGLVLRSRLRPYPGPKRPLQHRYLRSEERREGKRAR